MSRKQKLWVLAGSLWFVGAIFQALAHSPAIAAMYIAVGCLFLNVGRKAK